MRVSDSGPNGRQKQLTGPCVLYALSRLPAAGLVSGLTFGAFAADARGQGVEIPFGEVWIILETNATDCDTGLQLFFDGDPWSEVTVKGPNNKKILSVSTMGALAGFGATEQFNETNEPVMQELFDGFPEHQCDEPEFTLAELFALFPEGVYEFDGTTVEGDRLDGEATLSHVIPAAPEIVGPTEDDGPQNLNNTILMWDLVEEPILPGFGRGPGKDEVEIVGFHVVVEREEVGGVPAPLVVFTVDLPPDITDIQVPPEFLEPDASYKFEVLQIDVSGNQTIAEDQFETN